MDMKDLVDQYIRLRDKKAEITAKAKQECSKLDAVIDKLEAALLASFEEMGLESIRTAEGTAYKATRTSATVADWDATLDWIKANEMWNMLDKRVNKTAVQEFRDENDDLPPGVSWREEITVNVRRG